MSSSTSELVVRSHVARDLLQNAALFKTDKLVVWEYVSNGLQYVDHGTNPVVEVYLDSKKKRIVVEDNGRGMDWPGLQNFFVMHGENLDRREGKPGRGRFGTGKSAAFGIADLLRVTTVRGGYRHKVELTRQGVEKMGEGFEIPVRVLESEKPTDAENGTIIEIENIHLASLDQAGIVHYIERHLAHWPKNCSVLVNKYECEYSDPPVSYEKRFRPEPPMQEKLGDVFLTIKVSKVPLDPELRGVSIYADGVWHETTLAGSEGREMSQYLFGDIDVPRLDDDKSPISPFDLSRSMRLNPNNQLVQVIYAFVGRAIEQVRKQLLEAERERKATEEAQKLSAQASEIARLINEDFEAFRQRIAKVRAKSRGHVDKLPGMTSSGNEKEQEDDLTLGGNVPVTAEAPVGDLGSMGESTSSDGSIPRDLSPQVARDPEGTQRGKPTSGENGKARYSRGGGFSVKFKGMGNESHRAQYTADERTIYINLDHPQLSAARGSLSIDDPGFRRLAYEVAFSEYAVALASELYRRDEYLDAGEPIFDIRETLNRLARKGATLYA